MSHITSGKPKGRWSINYGKTTKKRGQQMKVSLNIPWNRYGLIAEIAFRLKDRSFPQFGKTILQKMVFLLQEAYGIPCDYQFDLYTFGPFTSQLLQDLDLVETLGGVKVYPVISGLGGYHIVPGEKNDALREKAKDFLQDTKVSRAIDTLLEEFGSFNAKELELISTIIYVNRDMKTITRDKMVEVVNGLKPKFSRDEIHEAIGKLEARHIEFHYNDNAIKL
jgi:uncharacterized protein YwgA